MKKIVCIFLLLGIADLFTSCCKDCPETKTLKFSIDNIAFSLLDNSGPELKEAPDVDIPKTAFGLRVTLSPKELVFHQPTDGYFLFQSAYAYKCICPADQSIFMDSISSIVILSKNRFNTTKGDSSDITEYFSLYQTNAHSYTPINTFLANQIESNYGETNKMKTELNLLLMKAPETGSLHTFTIIVNVSDGRKFSYTTPELTLN